MKSTHAFHFFLLPTLQTSADHQLRVLILADGNGRLGADGYAMGAQRVIDIGTHAARTGRIEELIVCIWSRDNNTKRGEQVVDELTRQFHSLRQKIEKDGVWKRDGVEMVPLGDLEQLVQSGGSRAKLADAISRAAASTQETSANGMKLFLGVAYDEDIAIEHDVHIILRTGMEHEGVVRLSGLRAHAGALVYATNTLWPQFDPTSLDRILNDVQQQAIPRFARGYGLDELRAFFQAFQAHPPAAPMDLTVPVRAADHDVLAWLKTLEFLGRKNASVVVHHTDRNHRISTYGLPHEARHVIRLFVPHRGRMHHERGYDAILAPGQTPPVFVLPEDVSPGYANVHSCKATATSIVQTFTQAIEYASLHVSLCGGERKHNELTRPAEPIQVQQSTEEDFVARALKWARDAGLLQPDAPWHIAALNYARTAYHIPDAHNGSVDIALLRECAAQYMLIVAAGDYESFDVAFPGERASSRVRRIGAMTRYLQARVANVDPLSKPHKQDATVLEAIATQWHMLMDRCRPHAHPMLFKAWVEGIDAMYASCYREAKPRFLNGTLLRRLAHVGTRNAARVLISQSYAMPAPRAIGRRIEQLVQSVILTKCAPSRELSELRILLHLVDTHNSMAAGLLFRTYALLMCTHETTPQQCERLANVAELLDYLIRLANDLSGFRISKGSDLDPKTTACSLLMPPGTRPTARDMREVADLCQRVLTWLRQVLQAEMHELASVWPAMATMVDRGLFIATKIYEVAHYTTLSSEQMNAIVLELEDTDFHSAA